jgi:hypothetical protein
MGKNFHVVKKCYEDGVLFVVRTYKLDRNEGKSFLRRGQAKVLFKTGTLLLNIESKRGFPLCILTIVSYLYVYIHEKVVC